MTPKLCHMKTCWRLFSFSRMEGRASNRSSGSIAPFSCLTTTNSDKLRSISSKQLAKSRNGDCSSILRTVGTFTVQKSIIRSFIARISFVGSKKRRSDISTAIRSKRIGNDDSWCIPRWENVRVVRPATKRSRNTYYLLFLSIMH